MKVRKTLIAVAVAALIPLGAAAIAGDNDYGSKDKAGAGVSFKKLDTNKDGRISQTEAAADSDLVFSTADTNGDGYIDNAEWKAAMKKDHDSGMHQQSIPSSQSPESSSPNSPSSSSETDPNMPQGTQPSGNRPPDTETPRQ
jgi:hypothetical protein